MPTTMFLGMVAVLVGLANPALLTIVTNCSTFLSEEGDANVGRSPSVRAHCGGRRARDLTTDSEVVQAAVLAQKFFDRYANMVFIVCISGTLVGFLLAAALTLK